MGPILFLLYVNDSIRRWYLPSFQIKIHLNVDFNSLCKWFIDNKVYIWGLITLNVFYSKTEKKQYHALNITRNENKIKQYSVVEYLGCLLDENMSEESMAKRALKNINGKTKFLYRQNRYLSYPLKRVLSNSDTTTFWFCMLCLVSTPVDVTEE